MAIPSGYSLLGRIGYNDRGVYTESSDYVRGDVVYHEGSSYVALTTVTGFGCGGAGPQYVVGDITSTTQDGEEEAERVGKSAESIKIGCIF